MATEVFTIAEDFPHPPKHRPGLRRALRYSGEGGWPAGDLYVVWPEAATAGCLEARALVYLPDERVPVFVGLTRLNPADWQDTGPAAVMLSKRNQACWQGGSFLATCRPGWNHVRLVADLDRRLAYAFARQEDRPDEEMLAWEAPIAVEGKDLRANALYLRTDLGYSPGNAYFADLRVQPCAPPTAPPLSLAADLSHVSPPNAAEDLSGIWDFLPVKAGDASTAEPPSLPPDDARWLRIIVPAEHDPLMRAHDVNRAWFRRTIKVPAAWQAKLLGDVIGPETGLQVSVVKLRLGGL
jgi:hypothetical protein